MPSRRSPRKKDDPSRPRGREVEVAVGEAELEAFLARARRVVADVEAAMSARATMLAFLEGERARLGPAPAVPPSADARRRRARRGAAPAEVRSVPRSSRPSASPSSPLDAAVAAIGAAPEGLANGAVVQLLGAASADEAFALMGPALREGRVVARKVSGQRRWFPGPGGPAVSTQLPPPLQDLLGRIEEVLAASPGGLRVSDIADRLANVSADEVFAALGLLGSEGRAVRKVEGKKRLWFAQAARA